LVRSLFKRKYDEIDPTVRRTPAFWAPFLRDQRSDRCQLLPPEQAVLAEGREAGLKCGISVPLSIRAGLAVSFASRFGHADSLDR
jgi:hypothetical protein